MPITSSSYVSVSQSQSSVAPETEANIAGLINTKKANIRAYLLTTYNLESDNLEERKEDLISFLKAIDNTAGNQGEANALSEVFRGHAGQLASSAPKEVVDTPEQVVAYVLDYIPDIVHKSIHGAYPEGRGQAIHGQNSEQPVEPMPEKMVTQVYEALGKKTSEPLLEQVKLQQLQAIPQAQPSQGAEANREPNRLNQNVPGTYLSGSCCIAGLSTICASSYLSDMVVAQALSTAGSSMLGLGANILASTVTMAVGAHYASTSESPDLGTSLVASAAVAGSAGFGYLTAALAVPATMANAYGVYVGLAGLAGGCLVPTIAGVGAYALSRAQDTRTPETRIAGGGVEIQRLNTTSHEMMRS